MAGEERDRGIATVIEQNVSSKKEGDDAKRKCRAEDANCMGKNDSGPKCVQEC